MVEIPQEIVATALFNLYQKLGAKTVDAEESAG